MREIHGADTESQRIETDRMPTDYTLISQNSI